MATLSINLKNNPNISFDIKHEFCGCGKVMFLRQNDSGEIFWSCKGYHPDKQKMTCDHTRDVKCFKCSTGELIKKQNGRDSSFFYGCTNYSNISNSSCNFVLQENDIKDVINQVNEGLKFFYNFKSTISNESDDQAWEKRENIIKPKEKTPLEPVKSENVIVKHLKCLLGNKETDCSKATTKIMGLPPKLAGYIATAVLTLGLITSLNGMNVEISLFGDLFKINIQNATSEDIQIEIDNEQEIVTIENTKNKAVDISNLSLQTHDGHELIDFSLMTQSQKILKPHEKMVLHEHDLVSMVEKSMKNTEGGQILMSSIQEESYAPPEESNEGQTDSQEKPMEQKIIDNFWENSSEMEFVAEIIEKGLIKYEEINEKVINVREGLQQKSSEYLQSSIVEKKEIEENENLQETDNSDLLEEIEQEDKKLLNPNHLSTGFFR